MSAMLGGGDPTTKPGIAGRISGVQAGGLLAFMSGAILGQYDPFTTDPDTGSDGVLMLVTPNIIAVERSLKVVPSDFRLWVCLHEVTHRVQFSANPWLRGYMLDNIAQLSEDTGESSAELVNRISSALRSGKPREKGVMGAMQLLQTPEQYDAFSRLMMLGTLLEGHADHVLQERERRALKRRHTFIEPTRVGSGGTAVLVPDPSRSDAGRTRLGDLLVGAGAVKRETLEVVAGSEDGRRIGEQLRDQGLLREYDLVRGLSEQLHIPIVDLRDANPEDAATAFIDPADGPRVRRVAVAVHRRLADGRGRRPRRP